MPTYDITEPPVPWEMYWFANFQVPILFYRTCTLLHGAMKFQEQLNYEISNILIANSDYLVSDCCKGWMEPKSWQQIAILPLD